MCRWLGVIGACDNDGLPAVTHTAMHPKPAKPISLTRFPLEEQRVPVFLVSKNEVERVMAYLRGAKGA